MPDRPLSSENTAPRRFRQIADTLRASIQSGRLAPHQALPSERSLAEEEGVSRMTARRALEVLDTEGVSYRTGRKGRFVSPRRLSYDITHKLSLAAEAQSTTGSLHIEVLDKITQPATPELARALSVAEGAPLHSYTRLFLIDGHAAFLEVESVVAQRFPDLLDYDLSQSTTRILERHYATEAHTGDITIRMRAMQPAEADQLGVEPYHAGIELQQITRDASGVAFCFGTQIWRGELAEFTARAIVSAPPQGQSRD
ncbi:GntR family transcriptional regulator [Pararhodobacter oceanensis]|uniref:GntR family transcriptional regulator n=2 Tax=Pararhodobacter oceanensis TaxID=2172121 RepID=A0A2T8HPI8_9RHOB|nr:GntR family transcriptional regulator [Pararhodobacter oceanensis]